MGWKFITKNGKINKNYEKFMGQACMGYYSTQLLLRGRTFEEEVLDNPFIIMLLDKHWF